MNTVTVKINGVEYNLKGKENEKYLLAVAEYVDGKFKEISSNNSKLSITAVAVLSALNITDEYFKCELENEELIKRKNSLEEKCATLKERLREVKAEYEEQNQIKNNEVDNLKNIICSMEEKIKELDTLYSTIDELKRELELTKEKLQNESKELQNKYDIEINELKDNFNKEKESLIQSFNKNICELNENLKEKEENIISLNLQNEKLEKIENSLNDKLVLKENEIQEIKKNNEEVNELISAIKEEKESLIKAFDKDICELKDSIIEKDDKISLLNLKSEELQKKEISLKDKLVSKENEIREIKKNNEEVNELINAIKEEKESLIKAFDKDICELKDSIIEKDEKISLLSLKNKELEKIETSLKDELVLKEKEIEDVKHNSDEINELKNKISCVEKEKEVLKNDNRELKFKLQNSKYKLLYLEKKLNDANFNLAIEKKVKNPLLK